jgi:sterol desaturase/sphingolipid hydroxylase (fatty acid hydroxylase superfamily)
VVPRLLPELSLILMTAVATHLVMSFAQTLMHYKLGHHPIGGKFFRNHINFHHTYYAQDHLVSPTYLGDEGNNTPFFFIPVFLVGACTYLLLPLDLFMVQVVACAASFYAHVFFDKEYHVEGSRLQRFAWFRRKQELHFVHHRHANSNFAVIHFFWDRILGTYRSPDAGQTQTNGTPRIRFPRFEANARCPRFTLLPPKTEELTLPSLAVDSVVVAFAQSEIGWSDWKPGSDWEPGLLPFPSPSTSALEREQGSR